MAIDITIEGQLARNAKGKLSSSEVFPFPTNYFIPAKMPMNLIYPRPDAETQAHARHRNYHSSMPYLIPIGVQGGAWPFKYEIISAPSGATIGQYYGQTNYGQLLWNPTGQTGTQTFSVRVTDQQGNQTLVIWTATHNDAAFVFTQSGYAGTKTGTVSQPLATFADWYKGSQNDATYHNKILVFRGGNYSLVGNVAEDNGNIRLKSSSKTPSWISYPGETPILDCSTAKILEDGAGLNDIFMSGITFANARTDVANAHFFLMVGNSNRATWHNCTFDTMTAGTAGDDNPGCLFNGDTTSHKNYYYVSGCEFKNINNNNGNGHYHDFYNTSNILVERCVAKNCNISYGFWIKASRSFITLRDITAIENCSGTQIALSLGLLTGDVPHDIEVCWSRVSVPYSQDNNALLFVNDTDWQNQWYNIYFYRCSVYGGYVLAPGATGAENLHTDANIIVTADNTGRWDTTRQTTTVPNFVTNQAGAIIDSSGDLLGSTGFATHGWRPY